MHIQVTDGFKSGLSDAMNSYSTKPNKKDAVDGIQEAVCISLCVCFTASMLIHLV